jgi:hypothetical protein
MAIAERYPTAVSCSVARHPPVRVRRRHRDIRRDEPIPFRPMSRRIEIELTSSQGDGSWTWRAAGAKNPRGVLDGSLLPAGAAVGTVLRVEVEQGLDGIEVIGLVGGRQRTENAERIEILGGGEFQPVIETRSARGPRDDRRGDRRGDRRPPRRDDRRDGRGEDRRPGGRDGGDDRRRDRREQGDTSRRDSGDRRARGPRFTPPPEMPQRPKPKRLRAGKAHRSAVLAGLSEQQRPIAELALQGMAAVRSRLRSENERLVAEGREPMPEATVLALAEDLLPRLRVAEWTDRAEAALAQLDDLDLRDLRSVVAASEDPIVARDDASRELASRLRDALRMKQEQELQLWFGDVDSALAIGRVIRALRLSSQPPKAGVVFPADIAKRLVDSTNATLTPVETPERWIAVLEAAAFSPIRSLIVPMGMPATVTDELRATVTRLAPALPQIAALFGIEVPAGAPMPRPLRTPPKGKTESRVEKRPPRTSDAARTAAPDEGRPAGEESASPAATDGSTLPDSPTEQPATDDPPAETSTEADEQATAEDPPTED